MKPEIIIPPTTMNVAEADELKKIFAVAVEKLFLAGAWPDTCGKYEIHILNDQDPNLKDLNSESVSSILTIWDTDRFFLGRKLRRTPRTTMLIQVSVDLFKTGAGQRLFNLWPSEADIAFFFLAHEIHHLTEVEGLIACGIKPSNVGTQFAGAARTDFPKTWKTAIKALTDHFPSPEYLTDLSIKTAADIANEACADLSALHWMRVAEMQHEQFTPALIEYRRQNARAGVAYEIADAIQNLAIPEIPVDLKVIQAKCWEMAIDKAMESPLLGKKLANQFKELRSLPLELIAPEMITNVVKPRGQKPH